MLSTEILTWLGVPSVTVLVCAIVQWLMIQQIKQYLAKDIESYKSQLAKESQKDKLAIDKELELYKQNLLLSNSIEIENLKSQLLLFTSACQSRINFFSEKSATATSDIYRKLVNCIIEFDNFTNLSRSDFPKEMVRNKLLIAGDKFQEFSRSLDEQKIFINNLIAHNLSLVRSELKPIIDSCILFNATSTDKTDSDFHIKTIIYCQEQMEKCISRLMEEIESQTRLELSFKLPIISQLKEA